MMGVWLQIGLLLPAFAWGEEPASEPSEGEGEGDLMLLGFRSTADRPYEVNAELGVMSAWYDRGQLQSGLAALTVQPGLAISFDFGGYASLQTTSVLYDRGTAGTTDEVALNFGFNNHSWWLDFDAGYSTYFYPSGPEMALTNEIYLNLGTGDVLKVITPTLVTVFMVGGRYNVDTPSAIGWYGQARLDVHHDVTAHHGLQASLNAGAMAIGVPGVQPVDIAAQGYYFYTTAKGVYVSPGLGVAWSFLDDRVVPVGSLRVGVTR